VEGLGIALAACSTVDIDSKSATVFVGTYAGAITGWRIPFPSTLQGAEREKANNTLKMDVHDCVTLPPLSCINAHRPGCAVFAVQVLLLCDGCGGHAVRCHCSGTGSNARFFVATCSDDRSATLYVSIDDSNSSTPGGSEDHYCSTTCRLTEKTKWICCWRGCGHLFSRRRLFDISLRVVVNHEPILLATGGEDGSVQVFSFNKKSLVEIATSGKCRETGGKIVTQIVPVTLLRRLQQHDGGGVYKVLLVEHSAGASCAHSVRSVCAVVSCGFDGCVQFNPVPPMEPHNVLVVRSEQRKGQKQHVRGVFCDNNGVLLVCTENELVVAEKVGSLADEQRYHFPTACVAKRDMPSCLNALVCDQPLSLGSTSHYATSLALVGTTCGNVYGVPYRWGTTCNPSGTSASCGGNRLGAVIPVSAQASPTKVLFLQGMCYGQELLMTSVHAGGQLVVCSTRGSTGMYLRILFSTICPGTHTTSLSVFCIGRRTHADERLCIFTGDDGGALSSVAVELNEPSQEKVACSRQSIFCNAVVAVHADGTGKSSFCTVEEKLSIISSQGEWRVVVFNTQTLSLDSCHISCQLRFPWRVSTVLAWMSRREEGNGSCNVAVTLHGTDISVIVLRSAHSNWQLVAQCHDVRAPRLLAATISYNLLMPPTEKERTRERWEETKENGVGVHVCHCSDGVKALWYNYNISSYCTRLLHGGVAAGRDYNAVLFLPCPSPCVVCGTEHSLLNVVPLCQYGGFTGESSLTLLGPHDSNVLAASICGFASFSSNSGVCDVRARAIGQWDYQEDGVQFVTVGGMATVALWQWSERYSWRVVANRTSKQGLGESSCGASGDAIKAGVNQSTAGGVSQGVPRYLSVCTTAMEIVVGSSDGTLKIFKPHAALNLCHSLVLSPSAPKPVTAVCTLSGTERLVAAGDTSGLIAVVCAASGRVLSSSRFSTTAVNALSAVQCIGNDQQREMASLWCVLVAMDSGDVLLLSVGLSAVQLLSSVRVGLTAVRGVSWVANVQVPRGQRQNAAGNSKWFHKLKGMAVAANDEQLLLMRENSGKLTVVAHRRLNVRGISSLALGVSVETFSSDVLAVVVGQGMEVIPLSCVDQKSPVHTIPHEHTKGILPADQVT
ncbi:hypothetical protein, conserved, partial [Trypanosoma vivax Y486]